MISPPWVILERRQVPLPPTGVQLKKRIRGKRNRRNFFTPLITPLKATKDCWYVTCLQHLEHGMQLFYSHTLQTVGNKLKDPTSDLTGFPLESTADFKGFCENDIALSYEESIILRTSLKDLFQEATRRPMTISSRSSTGKTTSWNCIFKVLPLSKRPLRVLSLFDGLCTALYILKYILQIQVEVYFASEIDQDALSLQRKNFFGEVVQLGDALKLDQGLEHKERNELLDSLGRIDLVIGGSPCNDISRVNGARKGLNGLGSSGQLLYSFCRIRDYLMTRASSLNSHMFWFYENTTHINAQDQKDLTEALQCSTVKCCSSTIMPNPRMRQYSGNIPMLQSNCAKIKEMTPLTLQDVIGPSKQALVKKVPTITTKGFSRKTGAPQLYPIAENGEKCHLSAIDYELLLGFPKNFTDNDNLSRTRRINLLGRSWSVPVVTKLLEPLADIFECK